MNQGPAGWGDDQTPFPCKGPAHDGPIEILD